MKSMETTELGLGSLNGALWLTSPLIPDLEVKRNGGPIGLVGRRVCVVARVELQVFVDRHEPIGECRLECGQSKSNGSWKQEVDVLTSQGVLVGAATVQPRNLLRVDELDDGFVEAATLCANLVAPDQTIAPSVEQGPGLLRDSGPQLDRSEICAIAAVMHALYDDSDPMLLEPDEIHRLVALAEAIGPDQLDDETIEQIQCAWYEMFQDAATVDDDNELGVGD